MQGLARTVAPGRPQVWIVQGEVGVKIGIINGEGYETVCRRMR